MPGRKAAETWYSSCSMGLPPLSLTCGWSLPTISCAAARHTDRSTGLGRASCCTPSLQYTGRAAKLGATTWLRLQLRGAITSGREQVACRRSVDPVVEVAEGHAHRLEGQRHALGRCARALEAAAPEAGRPVLLDHVCSAAQPCSRQLSAEANRQGRSADSSWAATPSAVQQHMLQR